MGRLTDGENWTAQAVIEHLGLIPLPEEGGYFRETYRSEHALPETVLPPAYRQQSDRRLATAIYYLLTPETYSALHTVRGDEIYHFYLGDAVDMVCLDPAEAEPTLRRITLGPSLTDGHTVQHLVPAGVWQGSRLAPGGKWALMGTTVHPGFEFADRGMADASLLERYPQFAEALRPLMPTG